VFIHAWPLAMVYSKRASRASFILLNSEPQTYGSGRSGGMESAEYTEIGASAGSDMASKDMNEEL